VIALRDKPIVAPVRHFALTRAEAAASLGISLTTFDELVAPDVKRLRVERRRARRGERCWRLPPREGA
jgi:hypothetical protein